MTKPQYRQLPSDSETLKSPLEREGGGREGVKEEVIEEEGMERGRKGGMEGGREGGREGKEKERT